MAALPETLKSITDVKIQELTNQRNTFENAKAAIYKHASSADDEVEETQSLLDGVRRLRNVQLLTDDSSDDDVYQTGGPVADQLRNKALLLRQARVDPSVPPSVVSTLQNSLKRELDLESIRHEHAQFFSKLVTEWLSNPDQAARNPDASTFEEVGRKEMHEQRATWESLVFSEGKADESRIDAYLRHLFTTSKPTELAYEDIVKSTKTFGSLLKNDTTIFDHESLKDTMAGLLQTDLLSEEKNATIRTFMSNTEVLKEVSDVLNMRSVSLKTWNWSTVGDGIPVEMRRQLNGKYRVFMDEDVLDALFIYEIGLKWAVHFKEVFLAFFDSHAWQRSERSIPKLDRQKRDYYIQRETSAGGHNIQDTRRSTYRDDYFLTQLPIDESVGKRNYDDDNDDDDDGSAKQKNPLDLKHGLLHMLVGEALVAKHVRPETVHSVLRSDFKWFGPALPHATIFSVLKFFGVDDEWLEFFRKFLRAPLFFVQDGKNAQVQSRKRGVPMSHSLSDVFGEVVLFVMDYAVNQATSAYLYRLHDDFWLWGSDEVCLKGWQAMTTFAQTMDIEFNTEKTGTVRFGAAKPSDLSGAGTSGHEEVSAFNPETTRLPEGEVRWGFLRLDASSGRFLVDQSQVDEHIKELQNQLSYCKSIFSYIQSYNAYVGRFFTNNFGKPSYAFGREHVDMMISTFARIQKALFPSGSVTDHLASLAAQRFNIKELPQGFWYFPVEQGGLELRNPLIPLLGMRESLRLTPQRMFEKWADREEKHYLNCRKYFLDNNTGSGLRGNNSELGRQLAESGENFMSKEEFLRYPEEKSRHLNDLYKKLLTVPPAEQIQATAELSSLLTRGSPSLPAGGSRRKGKDVSRSSKDPAILSNFVAMQPYWKWTVALYGEEIAQRYGSLGMVDSGQVPLGVVSLMKKGRVRWRG